MVVFRYSFGLTWFGLVGRCRECRGRVMGRLGGCGMVGWGRIGYDLLEYGRVEKRRVR